MVQASLNIEKCKQWRLRVKIPNDGWMHERRLTSNISLSRILQMPSPTNNSDKKG